MLSSSPIFKVELPSKAVVTSTTTSWALDVVLTSPNVTLPPLYVAFALSVWASAKALSFVLTKVKWLSCVGDDWLEIYTAYSPSASASTFTISPVFILLSEYTAAKLLLINVWLALASPTPKLPTYFAPLT